MNAKKIFLLTFIICGYSILSFAQDNPALAREKGEKAVKLADEGKLDEAISLLKEANKLDPASIDYKYEIGYCYYMKKDFKQAVNYFNDILYHPKSSAQIYQMLGNIYDDMGDTVNAEKTYKAGLKKYPNAGGLYTELGTFSTRRSDWMGAINYYEKGIEMAPMYPSNYYWVAKIFLTQTQEEVWGMIYGETFINLEPNSKRTEEMSKLLYDTYKSEIKWTSETEMSISFSKNTNMTPGGKMPFPLMAYEPILSIVSATHKPIDYDAMCSIRKEFINLFFERNMQKDYPVALFDFNYKVMKAGHFDTYNHWLLSRGDMTAFNSWMDKHEEDFKRFAKWLQENRLTLNDKTVFLRKNFGG